MSDELQIQYTLVEQLSNKNRRQAKHLALLDECIFECDQNFSLIYINETWQSKLGYSSYSLIGKPLTDLMNTRDVLHLTAYACGLIEGATTFSIELQMMSSAGLANWFELKLAYDNEGRFVGSLYDIQRYKDFQFLSIQQQEYAKRLSLVASHTKNLVIITDRFGFIEWVNNSFEALTGYKCENIVGQSPGKLLQGPKTNKNTCKVMSEAVKSGQSFQVETINYDKNGDVYWVAIDANPVKDEFGDVRHFIAIQTNITQRVQAQQAMAEIEYNYHSVVDNIPDIVLRLDTQGNLLFINKAWKRLFNSEAHKNIGLPIIKFIAQDDIEKVNVTLLNYERGQRDICRFDIRLINFEGETNWVEMTLTPIVSSFDNSLSSIAATLVDIQERIEAEHALQKANTKL